MVGLLYSRIKINYQIPSQTNSFQRMQKHRLDEEKKCIGALQIHGAKVKEGVELNLA